jgi:hypothetical protein
VFRVGAAAVSISSLSAKAADNTAHADGAIRAVSGNLYTVDLPDAVCADQVPSISVKGSYTGGVIEGPEHPLVGYNPASVAVGALTPLVAGRQIAVAATTGAVELDSDSRDAVADAVWDEAMADHTGSGSYGGRVVRASNSNTTVQITGSHHVAADVHKLQAGVITAGDFANNSITAAALATDAVAEIQNGLSTLTAPQVNAEVVDALSVDTYAELTAPPAATSSLKDKITWLFMYARNKVTQTASQRKLYRDDGSTVAGTSATSDTAGTFTKGEDA